MTAALVGTLYGLALATFVGETLTVSGGLEGVVGAFFGALVVELQRTGVADRIQNTNHWRSSLTIKFFGMERGFV